GSAVSSNLVDIGASGSAWQSWLSRARRRGGRSWRRGCRRRRHRSSNRQVALFALAGGIDISLRIGGHGGDFFFGRTVQHERFPRRRYAIDKPAAVGAGDNAIFGINGQRADMSVIALEEYRALAIRGHAENLALIAG